MNTDVSDSRPLCGSTGHHLAVFVAIVDRNGFAAAARHLGRSQSDVAYAIEALESKVGIQIFEQSTYRPTLTVAGRTLLLEARRLLADMNAISQLELSSSTIAEAELTIVTDMLVPVVHVANAIANVQSKSHCEHPAQRGCTFMCS